MPKEDNFTIEKRRKSFEGLREIKYVSMEDRVEAINKMYESFCGYVDEKGRKLSNGKA